MTNESGKKNIFEKLQACRVALQDMKLKKSGENKFAKFKYYELKDFLPSVNVLFKQNKLFSNFSIIDDKATLRIYDAEAEGSYIDFVSNIASADVKGCTAIQSLGAEHTYLKRYLYLNALEIVEDDSLDSKVGSDDFEPENPVNGDLDIISGIDALNTTKEISEYFNKYNSLVKDKTGFVKAINARKAVITKGN